MIHTHTTPSGVELVFEDGAPDSVTGHSKRRSYTANGQKLVSVTTILGILDKPGLMWAAEKLTAVAACELAREGELPLHPQAALSRMQARGLRFRQVWDAKAERGTVTHEDLVRLAMGEQMGDVDDFPADQRGFIRGVSGWFADARPQMIDAEQMVVSLTHGFAGRRDIFCTIPTFHATAKVLLDVKTTETLPTYKSGDVKAPYDEMLLQLAGYELAGVESGYPPSDIQAVLRVDATGKTDFYPTVVDTERFLDVLRAYRAVKSVKDWKPVRLEAAA